MRLRALLKFDFYFADSATFRRNIAEELEGYPNGKPNSLRALTQTMRCCGHVRYDQRQAAVLEAYEIVADVRPGAG